MFRHTKKITAHRNLGELFATHIRNEKQISASTVRTLARMSIVHDDISAFTTNESGLVIAHTNFYTKSVLKDLKWKDTIRRKPFIADFNSVLHTKRQNNFILLSSSSFSSRTFSTSQGAFQTNDLDQVAKFADDPIGAASSADTYNFEKPVLEKQDISLSTEKHSPENNLNANTDSIGELNESTVINSASLDLNNSKECNTEFTAAPRLDQSDPLASTPKNDSVAGSSNVDCSAPESTENPSESTSNSIGNENDNELILDFLPEPPTPIEGGLSTEYLGIDPPLDSLGLASWWPPGRMQYFLEYLHSPLGIDLPWWTCIIIATVMIRTMVLPMVIFAQQNVTRLNNNMPQMQVLQEKMSDARRRGDTYDSAVLGQEMQKFMKEKNINPIKNIVPILFQLPFFMSMFLGLRGMANLPLESMMSGGLYWFKDLTVPDPFCVLPALVSLTLFLQIRIGADGMSSSGLGPMVQQFIKVVPVILFFMTWNFPSALTFYWLTTNILSVTQAKVLRIEGVREKFGIPKMIKWDKKKLPVQDKSMREAFREAMDNLKVQNEITDRRTVDARVFREAGTARPKKTFKHDPTKPKTFG